MQSYLHDIPIMQCTEQLCNVLDNDGIRNIQGRCGLLWLCSGQNQECWSYTIRMRLPLLDFEQFRQRGFHAMGKARFFRKRDIVSGLLLRGGAVLTVE
jgi:hypothetical protein